MRTLISSLLFCATPFVFGQLEPLSQVVEKALEDPGKEAVEDVIRSLRRDQYAQVTPQLRLLFDRLSNKADRQNLALKLLKRTGQSEYFDEIAGYAQKVLTLGLPMSYVLGADGKPDRGNRNPAFDDWCLDRQIERSRCAQMVLDGGHDIALLAQTRDRRAIPLLRKALESEEPGIVVIATGGLAALKDTESIPQIAANLKRLPPDPLALTLIYLGDMDDPRVAPLIEAFVPDASRRRAILAEIANRRTPQK